MEEYFFHETHPLKVELNARYSVVRESRVTHICGPWFQANEKHCVCPKGTYVPWPLSTSYAPSLFKPHHVYTCTSRSVTWLSVFRHYEQNLSSQPRRPARLVHHSAADFCRLSMWWAGQIFILIVVTGFLSRRRGMQPRSSQPDAAPVSPPRLHLCLVCHQLLSWLCFIRIPTCDYMVGH